MAGGLDTSNRKPRHLRGTPALRFVNRLAFVSLSLCTALGYWMYNSDQLKRINEDHFPPELEIIDRKIREESTALLSQSLMTQKSAGEIRKVLRHQQKYQTET